MLQSRRVSPIHHACTNAHGIVFFFLGDPAIIRFRIFRRKLVFISGHTRVEVTGEYPFLSLCLSAGPARGALSRMTPLHLICQGQGAVFVQLSRKSLCHQGFAILLAINYISSLSREFVTPPKLKLIVIDVGPILNTPWLGIPDLFVV